MSVSVLSNLTLDQMTEIADYRRQSPITEVSLISGKARMACAAYFPEWHSTFTSYHNAILAAQHKIGVANPLRTITLLACAEELALANMAKDYLTVQEYNLLVYPIAKVVMPELFAEKQWELKELPEKPQISSVETHFKHVFEKKNRKPRDHSAEEVEEKGVDTEGLVRALLGMKKPKEEEAKPRPVIDPMEAIKAMLAKVKGEEKDQEEITETVQEDEEIIGVRVGKSSDGSFGLFNEKGDPVADGFATAITAISFVTKDKGLKLLK